jgi:hypothetical protein
MPFDRVDTCLTPTELSHIRVIPLPAKDASGTVQLDEQDWNYSSYVITPSPADRGARSGRPRGTLSEVGGPGWVRGGCRRQVDGTAVLPAAPEMTCAPGQLRLVPTGDVRRHPLLTAANYA